MAGGQQAFRDGLLPQLLPIFHCRLELRAAYGAAYSSSSNSSRSDISGGPGGRSTPDAETAAAHADSGYW